MKILTLLFVFLCSTTAYSQLTAAQLKARIDALKDDKNFKLEYDRFSGNSSLMLKPYDLIGKGAKLAGGILAQDMSRNGSPMIFGRKKTSNIVFSMALAVGFPFKGEDLAETPKLYTLTLSTASNEWQFLEQRTIYFLSDGERFEMRAVDRKSSIGNGTVAEILFFLVPVETLNQLANAKKVEVKAGQTEKVVKAEFLGLLKNLIVLSKV